MAGPKKGATERPSRVVFRLALSGVTATTAQVPSSKPAEDALGNIAGQGILGSLCVILIVALVWVARALLKEKDKRFTDQKALLDLAEKHNEAAKVLAIEATKSQMELSNALTNQSSVLTHVQRTVTSQQTALDTLTATVNRMDGARRP